MKIWMEFIFFILLFFLIQLKFFIFSSQLMEAQHQHQSITIMLPTCLCWDEWIAIKHIEWMNFSCQMRQKEDFQMKMGPSCLANEWVSEWIEREGDFVPFLFYSVMHHPFIHIHQITLLCKVFLFVKWV